MRRHLKPKVAKTHLIKSPERDRSPVAARESQRNVRKPGRLPAGERAADGERPRSDSAPPVVPGVTGGFVAHHPFGPQTGAQHEAEQFPRGIKPHFPIRSQQRMTMEDDDLAS